jgi:hypothetical protein
LLSQSVGVVPGDEYQLVVLDSVGDGMCCGYGDGSAAATVDTTVPEGQGLAVTAPATTSTAGAPIVVLPTTATATGGNSNGNTKRKKMLVARPFTVMRGHTAFLTFATAGILPQVNPNMELDSTS